MEANRHLGETLKFSIGSQLLRRPAESAHLAWYQAI
jgi:hypothetical protein